ncbi:hypothetical protein [Virgibacillus sp. CBA3643]|uniref:hypothetical protein n=1 Tax=Virgibacillus sp. CBA3643 TaxID=2942278 RepID=UPI0035A30FF1
MSNYLRVPVSVFISTIFFVAFLFIQKAQLHWYLIPLFITLIILCFDAVSVFNKGKDLFRPKPILALFGINFFVIAPIIYINDDSLKINTIHHISNWELWIGMIAIINLLGIIVYEISYRIISRKKYTKKLKHVWHIDSTKLYRYGTVLLVICFILQAYTYISAGGISSFVDSYAERAGTFENSGWIFMISESFPIILILMICIYLKEKGIKLKSWQVIIILILFFLIRLYFGGLRGSRSNVIWGMLWASGIINYTLYKFKRKDLILGIIFIIIFTFSYGFYKADSQDFLEVVRGTESVESLVDNSDESINHMLVGDLSRVHIQALVLNGISNDLDYKYAYGETYLSSLNILIPDSLEIINFRNKTHFGAQILMGTSHVELTGDGTTRIFGLVGESMLNFGLLFVLPVYILLAWIVHLIEKSRQTWIVNQDGRLFIYPMLVVSCLLILVQDSDNLIFTLVKNLSIPLVLLFMVSIKRRNFNSISKS